jgi:predicted porin
MKKSLVVLAIFGAFATSASAQTGVTVYGLVDAGIVSERGGAAGNVTKLTSGVQSGSRLGFKGTEDLGGGLTAKFVLESGFKIDDGTSAQPQAGVAPNGTLFGRQAYVGLGGQQWGNVTLGRQYTPHYLALTQIDPFGAGLAGDAANFIPTELRMNNTIKYTTPEWSGFDGELAYGFGEVPGNNKASRQFGGAIGYANGPIVVKLAHQSIENATATDRNRNTLLAGKWDFGVAAASLGVNFSKGPSPVNTRDYLLGVSVPFGASAFLASYIHKDDRSALNRDANQWALGYTYSMSKRTNLYTSYGRVKNKNGATFTVGNATEVGSGDKTFNIGVRHSF